MKIKLKKMSYESAMAAPIKRFKKIRKSNIIFTTLVKILSLFKDVPYGYQVGPRGLFHIWGYPKIYKFARTLKNKNKQEKIVELYNKKINEICKGDKYEK